jgi:hypothetical protein
MSPAVSSRTAPSHNRATKARAEGSGRGVPMQIGPSTHRDSGPPVGDLRASGRDPPARPAARVHAIAEGSRAIEPTQSASGKNVRAAQPRTSGSRLPARPLLGRFRASGPSGADASIHGDPQARGHDQSDSQRMALVARRGGLWGTTERRVTLSAWQARRESQDVFADTHDGLTISLQHAVMQTRDAPIKGASGSRYRSATSASATLCRQEILVDPGRSKRPAALGIRGFHPRALVQSALP